MAKKRGSGERDKKLCVVFRRRILKGSNKDKLMKEASERKLKHKTETNLGRIEPTPYG